MRRLTMLTVALVGAGVTIATSAFAGDNRSNNLPCPAMPPVSNTISTREGSVGLQLLGIGINGSRSRTAVENDVLIQSAGNEAYQDAVLRHQTCVAVVRLYPGDIARQLREVTALHERLIRRELSQTPRTAAPFPVVMPIASATARPQARDENQPRAVIIDPIAVANLVTGVVAPSRASATGKVTEQETGSRAAEQGASGQVSATDPKPARRSNGNIPAIDLSMSRSCGTLGWFGVGSSGVVSCSTVAGSRGVTSCITTPQTSYRPSIMIGNQFVPSMLMPMLPSTSCTTVF